VKPRLLYGHSEEVLKERHFIHPPFWMAEKYIKTAYHIFATFQAKNIVLQTCIRPTFTIQDDIKQYRTAKKQLFCTHSCILLNFT